MAVLFWLFAVAVLLFGSVLLFGAPYVPTLKRQVGESLNLLDLKPGQTLLELGCGDGRLLIAAAQKGVKSVGYELNPLLFVFCKLRTRRYRKLVQVKFQNYWTASWPPAEGIYVFLLQKYMPKLDKKIIGTYKGQSIKLVSLAFTIPDKKPAKTLGGLYLYYYR